MKSARDAQRPGGFRSVTVGGQAELREKGSVFLGLISPAETEAQARARLESIAREFSGASHYCFAWRLGAEPIECVEYCSDAGEPAGTAGQPILRVLRGREISDVLAVVVRWFGGTKLGKGGLARAYAGATAAALGDSRLEVVIPRVMLMVRAPYDRVGSVKRLIRPPAVELVDEDYESHREEVNLVLSVIAPHLAEVEQALANLGLDLAKQPS